MFLISLIFLFFLSSGNYISGQNSWTRKADFPGPRYKAVAFSIGDRGYAGTGMTPDSLKNDFWEYDPLSNTWHQKASLPGAGRTGAFAFSINNKGYIGAGAGDTLYFYDFWEYDPLENKWIQKADIPLKFHWPETMAAFSINGKGYLRGSYNNDDFWEYDPGDDVWTKKAKFPGKAVFNCVGFSIGDKGYIGTGVDELNFSSELWEYNPAADEWIKKGDFSGSPRSGAIAFVIGNKAYIGMGNTGSGIINDFWAYDLLADSWKQIDSCGYGADGAFAFSIGSKGYVGTGLFSYDGEFWEYDSNIVSVNSFSENRINDFILEQNYPNPFNPTTNIKFSIPQEESPLLGGAGGGLVTLKVYDVIGNEIVTLVNEEKQAGTYHITWDASGLAAGVYMYKLRSGSFMETKKLVLLK